MGLRATGQPVEYIAGDVNTAGNIIVAGVTKDTTLCPGNNVESRPIFEFINGDTLNYFWSVYLSSTTSDLDVFTVQAVKFNEAGSNIYAALLRSVSEKKLVFA